MFLSLELTCASTVMLHQLLEFKWMQRQMRNIITQCLVAHEPALMSQLPPQINISLPHYITVKSSLHPALRSHQFKFSFPSVCNFSLHFLTLNIHSRHLFDCLALTLIVHWSQHVFSFELRFIILSWKKPRVSVDRGSSPQSVGGRSAAILSPQGYSLTKPHCVWA